jgi:hypothetical protein
MPVSAPNLLARAEGAKNPKGGYAMFGCRDVLLQINVAFIGLAIFAVVVGAGLTVLATAQ